MKYDLTQSKTTDNNINQKKNRLVNALKVFLVVCALFTTFFFLSIGGWKIFALGLIQFIPATAYRIESIFIALQNRSSGDNSDKPFGEKKRSRDVEILTNRHYYIGSTVEYIINNNSNIPKVIYANATVIERFDETQQTWVPVRTKDECPCAAFCRQVFDFTLEPKGFISSKWNQKEEWCDGGVTISYPVPSGKYRIVSEESDYQSDWTDKELKKYKVYSEVFTISEIAQQK